MHAEGRGSETNSREEKGATGIEPDATIKGPQLHQRPPAPCEMTSTCLTQFTCVYNLGIQLHRYRHNIKNSSCLRGWKLGETRHCFSVCLASAHAPLAVGLVCRPVGDHLQILHAEEYLLALCALPESRAVAAWIGTMPPKASRQAVCSIPSRYVHRRAYLGECSPGVRAILEHISDDLLTSEGFFGEENVNGVRTSSVARLTLAPSS